MSEYNNRVPPITAPWPNRDIIYVSIMGTVMLGAFLEWFLWLAAFLYCLVKVYQKAEHWTVRLLAVLMMIGFTALRLIFLPIMIVTLPLPAQVTQYFPQDMVSFLQNFAFWSFAGLLTIPWLLCVYQLVTKPLGRKKRTKENLIETTAPKIVIVMPVYKETPEVLVIAIDSVVDCDYPPSCLHVFLSFDGDQEDELYLNTIERLGVPLTLVKYPSSIDIVYRQARITVSRFPHGGKRHCQKATFKLIDKIYTEYQKRRDNMFILFIDSDCILDKVCIQNFMYEMELKPGSAKNMLAMTGVITSTTAKNTLITLLQDMEYIHGQLFERSVESGCGSVTCLPGALTMLRFSAFKRMAKFYFADKAEQCDDLFDYGKCHLGEDRWLTHLFMIGATGRYQIQMCTGAFCKTEAVQTFRSLLKQRRRWFLGFITNEVCMLTDVRLWRRYPLVCVVRFMNCTIRTTALLFFIMIVSLITTEQAVKGLPVGFIAISLGLNWALMIFFGWILGRYKIWLYPIMFVINPFFNWVYMVYGIFTAGQRTWGGPRADAGAADTNKTPQQVIEHALETGDDLNIIPESFRPAIESRHPDRHPSVRSLQPPDQLEGRFAPAVRLRNGWFSGRNDSDSTLPSTYAGDTNFPRTPLHPRNSFDSSESEVLSVFPPRRIESIMGKEDLGKYRQAQKDQQEPMGAYMNVPPMPRIKHHKQEDHFKQRWQKSTDSVDGSEAVHVHHPYRAPTHSRRNSYSGSTSPPEPGSPSIAPTGPSRLRNGHSIDWDPEAHLPEQTIQPRTGIIDAQGRQSSMDVFMGPRNGTGVTSLTAGRMQQSTEMREMDQDAWPLSNGTGRNAIERDRNRDCTAPSGDGHGIPARALRRSAGRERIRQSAERSESSTLRMSDDGDGRDNGDIEMEEMVPRDRGRM